MVLVNFAEGSNALVYPWVDRGGVLLFWYVHLFPGKVHADGEPGVLGYEREGACQFPRCLSPEEQACTVSLLKKASEQRGFIR
jgi:hypothetical protein